MSRSAQVLFVTSLSIDKLFKILSSLIVHDVYFYPIVHDVYFYPIVNDVYFYLIVHDVYFYPIV